MAEDEDELPFRDETPFDEPSASTRTGYAA